MYNQIINNYTQIGRNHLQCHLKNTILNCTLLTYLSVHHAEVHKATLRRELSISISQRHRLTSRNSLELYNYSIITFTKQ